MNLYKTLRPLIFLQDTEKAHGRVLSLGRLCQTTPLNDLLEIAFKYQHPSLQTSVCGIKFENPVGLAAGFDKNAVLCRFIESLGFGFEEVGSITAMGGEGNPKPRSFRLPKDEALVNRMGLNGLPVEEVNRNLKRRKSKFPIGINIAKTHSPDIMGEKAIIDFSDSYLATMEQGDYVVLNISCPNTKEGKTFEDTGALKELLQAINHFRKGRDFRPMFLKISPDLSYEQLYKILELSEDFKCIKGYIIGNTSSQRQGLITSEQRLQEIGKGGLSGKPIRDKTTNLVRIAYRKTGKPIIGAGGIFTAQDAYEKIKAGASLVQVLTGMIYQGPAIPKQINKGLVRLLEQDGLENISQAVGVAA